MDAPDRTRCKEPERESQTACLSPDDSREHQSAIVRHVIERLRKMTAEAETMYRRYHEAADQAVGLQQQLTAAQERASSASEQLAAITGSRSFRLAQAIRRVLRVVSLRRSPRAIVATPGIAEEVAKPAASPRKAAAEQSAQDLPAPETSEAGKGAPLEYAPLRWSLGGDEMSEADLIGLAIFSANHRAGSTLLQRICNARKGTLIWGEHGGLLSHFSEIYTDAAYFSSAGSEEHRAYFASGEDPNLWIANMCPTIEYVEQAVVNSARAMLNTFYGQYRQTHDLIGFKEVAYRRPELELLRRCYPKAQFLLLVRNPLNTWRSTPRSWYPSLEDWIAKWNAAVDCFREFVRCDAGSHLVRYEDLIQQEPGTMGVLKQAAKVTEEEVAMVLSHKLGSHNAGVDPSHRELILDRCGDAMKALGYL
ncbi:MAG: sulfotransferase [Thermoguttaceae bacterium]